MNPTPSLIRQYLREREISVRAIAARLGVHPGHLQRVLNGEREGSRAFLKSVLEMAKAMPDRRQQRSDSLERLIDAATHVFFLQRGHFESEICSRASRSRQKE